MQWRRAARSVTAAPSVPITLSTRLPRPFGRLLAAAVVLAVLAGTAALAILTHTHSRDVTPARAVAAKSTPRLGPVSRDSLLVIGASYSAGWGATSPSDGYADLVGAALHWPTTVLAVPGSGYLNPSGQHRSTFAEQIQNAPVDLQPGLVLIQGGRNDAAFPSPVLDAAVCATVADARDRFPDAQVVLLSNIPAAVPVSTRQLLVEHTMISASQHCHAPLIDAIAEHWITTTNAPHLTGAVAGHPNDAGHRYIAQRVLDDLHRLGLIAGPVQPAVPVGPARPTEPAVPSTGTEAPAITVQPSSPVAARVAGTV